MFYFTIIHPCTPGSSNRSLPYMFPIKILYAFLFPRIRATCLIHLIILDFSILKLFLIQQLTRRKYTWQNMHLINNYDFSLKHISFYWVRVKKYLTIVEIRTCICNTFYTTVHVTSLTPMFTCCRFKFVIRTYSKYIRIPHSQTLFSKHIYLNVHHINKRFGGKM
jgi:hypothetical protein